MRRIVVTEFISLDGVIHEPGWSLAYWSDEIAAFKQAEFASANVMLLGRTTYEGFAEAWPSRSGDPYSDKFNAMPKYVVSTTLIDPAWNPTIVIRDNVVEEIRKLKEEPGEDIIVFGSGTLVRSLIPHGLIDRYHLLTYPIVLGTGQRLFSDEVATKLTLVEAKPFDTGAVALIYDTVPAEEVADGDQ